MKKFAHQVLSNQVKNSRTDHPCKKERIIFTSLLDANTTFSMFIN